MQPKPIIAIDIDDVLAANAAGFVEWSNQKFGTHLLVDDYQEHWAEMWKIERSEVEQRAHQFHESNYVSSYEVISDAREVLEQLKSRFTLILITSRRLSIEKLTREWIDANYPHIFKDIKADYLIDDQLKHIEAAAQVGIKGLLFGDYVWNRKDGLPSNVARVKNWGEILKYFNLK